jgi:hypothetical protein
VECRKHCVTGEIQSVFGKGSFDGGTDNKLGLGLDLDKTGIKYILDRDWSPALVTHA